VKLGKDCTGLKVKPETAREGLVEMKIRCHVCNKLFEKDDKIYVHIKEKEHPNPVCHKECRNDPLTPEPEPEVSEKQLLSTDKRLLWLEKLGYDGPKDITEKKAEELNKVWCKKPTSSQLESELEETGYDGDIPETNQETMDLTHQILWIDVPITEGQKRKIKQICELIGEEGSTWPTNKWEASLLIDSLQEKARQMGRKVSRLNIGFWSDE